MKTFDDIQLALQNDDQFVKDMVIAMYKRQAPAERLKKETFLRNGKGFDQTDAKRGTGWAQHLLKGKDLTPIHLKNCRQMLSKYPRQLAEIVEREERLKHAIEVAQAKCLSGLHERYGLPCDFHGAFACHLCNPKVSERYEASL